jgi:hypothetical protein
MSIEFEAQLAFVRDNPNGMGQCSNVAQAHLILDALLKEGMEPGELILRTRHTQFGGSLIGSLAQALKAEGRWLLAIPTIVNRARLTVQEGEWQVDDLLNALSDKDSLAYLCRHHLSVLTNYNHPLYGTDLSNYWSDQIRTHIGNGKMRRAWDALRVFVKGQPTINGPLNLVVVMISPEATIRLVDELYRVMAGQGLVPDTAPDVPAELDALYRTRPEERADGRPADYRSAEYQMIKHMFGHSGASTSPAFVPTSSRVIAIGNHFRQARNDDRKRQRQNRSSKTD